MCDDEQPLQLMAQAVPSAARVPCVDELPAVWGVSGAETVSGTARFSLGAADGGSELVFVTFTPTCPPPAADTQLIEVDGGCVAYRTSLKDPSVPSFGPGGGLVFVDRSNLVAGVEQRYDEVLCGAGAPPCP
jgi:hypothetical protein